jgi:hypothetical protein
VENQLPKKPFPPHTTSFFFTAFAISCTIVVVIVVIPYNFLKNSIDTSVTQMVAQALVACMCLQISKNALSSRKQPTRQSFTFDDQTTAGGPWKSLGSPQD